MQTIIPCLWFDMNAEEAANFYISVFKDGRIFNKFYYTGQEPGGEKHKGKVLSFDFELLGSRYRVINGGPNFPFTNAVSFAVDCKDQAEIDYYWDKLVEGGKPQQCGWLTDKYGLPWQIAPKRLLELMLDPKTAAPAQAAMMEMVKIDLAKIEAAVKDAKKAA